MELIKTYFYKLTEITQGLIFKTTTLFAAFFAPLQSIIFLCILLAFLDFFVKLHVVIVTEGRKAITSKKMENTLIKIMFYSAAIIVTHFLDILFVKDVGADFFNFFLDEKTTQILIKFKLAAATAFVIMIRELKSIDESWEQRFGWSFIDTVKAQISMFIKFRKNDTETTKNEGDK